MWPFQKMQKKYVIKLKTYSWFFTCQQTKNKRKLFNVIASFAKKKKISKQHTS